MKNNSKYTIIIPIWLNLQQITDKKVVICNIHPTYLT